MARITVEDCLSRVHNPFDLTMLAAERARQLNEGAPPADGADGHKSAVSALREIAAGGLDVRALREAAIERRQQAQNADERADDTPEPPPGDAFNRHNAAAIAADVEKLPVAGTSREHLLEDGGEAPEEGRAA